MFDQSVLEFKWCNKMEDEAHDISVTFCSLLYIFCQLIQCDAVLTDTADMFHECTYNDTRYFSSGKRGGELGLALSASNPSSIIKTPAHRHCSSVHDMQNQKDMTYLDGHNGVVPNAPVHLPKGALAHQGP